MQQAKKGMNNSIFRYKEDRWPVVIILLLSVLDLAMYFIVDNLTVFIVYYLMMIIPKGIISAWNHHLAHGITIINTYLLFEIQC